jgi:hypothetical protein
MWNYARYAAVGVTCPWTRSIAHATLVGMGRWLVVAIVVLALGVAPSSALATSQENISSTHATLMAADTILHSVVNTWPATEASLDRLNMKFAAECPDVGAGSPQNESEQKLSYEVSGALWATGYHADAKFIKKFTNTVSSLRWTNSSIVHRGLKFIVGLHEMVALKVPNLCADVRSWTAGGFSTVPPDTLQFDQHVEAINVEIPSLLMFSPYVQPSDRGLFAQVKHLITRFEELEFTSGQRFWNKLLETLALNQ